MTDTKINPADFTTYERPGVYKVTFRVEGEMTVEVKAGTKEAAEEEAEKVADRMAEDAMEIELDEVTDVRVDYVRPIPPMFRVWDAGRKMQVSRLEAHHTPRDPDERGF